MQIDFSIVIPYLPTLLKGLGLTLSLTLVCSLSGIVLGFLLSQILNLRFKLFTWTAQLYVEFFRGTPMLIQLFWIYFCFPILLGFNVSPIISVGIAMTLFMTAITCETFRGSFKSIEKEQFDACVALSLNSATKTIYIIFPQTLLRAIPPLLSNIVALFKESALVSSVGVADLMFIGQNLSNNTSRPIEFLTAVGLIYFAVAFPFTRLVGFIEKRLLRRFS